MKRQLKAIIGGATLFLMASSAQAFLVDGFGDDQGSAGSPAVIAISPPPPANQTDSDTQAITDTDLGGGSANRTLTVDWTGGLNRVTAHVDAGVYQYTQETSTKGVGMVTWDNFGFVDLTGGIAIGLDIVDLGVGSSNDVDISFELFDSTTASQTVTKTFNAGISGVVVGYSFNGAGIDLSDITKLKLTVDGQRSNGASVTIDIIESVPEPSALLLLSMGLIGLSVVGRRSRRKSA
jgi:hypothetical protein